MIRDYDLRRSGDQILLGIALEHAVLDLVTTEVLLEGCKTMLEQAHEGDVDAEMGTFGSYGVRMNLHHDDAVSIFIDGPSFEPARNLSAAVWVEKDEVKRLIADILENHLSPPH